MPKKFITVFLIASFLSTCGSALTNIGLCYRFLLEYHCGEQYGILMLTASITSVFISPLLGFYVDRHRKYTFLLIAGNIFLGLVVLCYSFFYSLFAVSLITIVDTAASIALSTTIFKLLPEMLTNDELLSINISLENINTYGIVFGPLIAPIIAIFIPNDNILFRIDAMSYVFTAILLLPVMPNIPKNCETPNQKIISTKKIITLLLNDFNGLRDIHNVKKVFLAMLNFYFAFSATAFSLALYASRAAGNSKLLYSVPIIAMFVGRVIGIKFISRQQYIHKNVSIVFVVALIGCGLLILPLGFITSLALLAGIEFWLGIFLAIAKISERTYLQYKFPSNMLGKIGAMRQSVQISVKLFSVPLVIFLYHFFGLPAVSVVFGILYICAAYVFEIEEKI